MNVVYLILLILAGACFLASAARVNSPRVNLLAAGLLFWVIEVILRVAQTIN